MTPDPSTLAAPHFMWHEILWLPSWQRLGTEADGWDDAHTASALDLAGRMETVRAWVGAPFRTHCWWRPVPYNAQIGGAANSAHIYGQAVDGDFVGLACGDVIDRILQAGMLDVWGLRMEDNGPQPGWCHLDLRAPGPSGRYFKP